MKGTGYVVVPKRYAYCGQFQQKPHGRGKVIFYEKGITYEGEMNKGAIMGKGILRQNDGQYEFQGVIEGAKPK